MRIDRSLYTYRPKRGEQAELKQRIKEICQTRVRYGYRRVHVLLVREGWPINMKRTRRFYNELGLQLRNKTPKRRVKAKLREDRTEATHSNQVGAMDFVHDRIATGRKSAPSLPGLRNSDFGEGDDNCHAFLWFEWASRFEMHIAGALARNLVIGSHFTGFPGVGRRQIGSRAFR